MRRVFGGRASRLEVYLLAAAMFVFAAGGIGGAVVLTANETTTVVMEASTTTSTSLDPSTTTSVPVPDTSPAEPTPPPTFAPPVTVLIPAPPQFTEQELATLQAQAQKGIAEQAAHDAWIRSLSIDGCPPGPYEQILVGWNGGVRDPAMTVSGAANSTNFVQLGVEVSRVANLGCVSVGLGGNGEPAGTWEVGWFNIGLFTAEHVRTALRNLGYL